MRIFDLLPRKWGHLTILGVLFFPAACADVATDSESTSAVEQAIWTSGFEASGIQAASGPALTSWGEDRSDVFYKGQDGHLWHGVEYKAWGWGALENLDGDIQSDPAAVAWGYNRVDVFVKGPNSNLWRRAWDGSKWTGWENLGGDLTSGPAVASLGVGQLDVFVKGPSNNNIWHRSFNSNTGWAGWENLGGYATSDPAAVASKDGKLHVFARGSDGAVWQKTKTGSVWTDWLSVGGQIVDAPSASSWGAGNLDIFARGADNQLWHRHFWGNSWGDWEALGGSCTSSPDSTSWGPNRVDVVVRGPDNQLYRKVWTDRLAVPLIQQEQSNWCWAATAKMIASIYGMNIAQCDQANNAFGRTDCCANPSSSNCNSPETPSTTFGHWGFGYTYAYNGGLTDAELVTELTANKRPVAQRWAWTGGGAHWFAVTDHLRFAGDEFVVKNDPWPPNVGEQLFISVAALRKGPGYDSTHTIHRIVKN